MAFPKFEYKQESETTPAKVAKLLKTRVEPRPERDSVPGLEVAKPLLKLLNSDTNPRQGAPRHPSTNTYPTHWSRVPELPQRWQNARRVDADGFGCLYRVQVGGEWYLLKFLPPFDGRVSIIHADGRVQVLALLEDNPTLPPW